MQAHALISMLIVLLWPMLGSLASVGTFEKQGSCIGDEVSLLQTAPGRLRRPLPPELGIEEWQQRGVDYSTPQMSRLLASRSFYSPQSESALPNMEAASAGREEMRPPGATIDTPDAIMYNGMQEPLSAGHQGTPTSFSQSLVEDSAFRGPAISEESAIERGIEQGRALQSALDKEQLTLQRTGGIAHGSAGYAEPLAVGEVWARRKVQSALQKAQASRLAAQSVIEKEAELEVSNALAIASERVRRAQAKALAAIKFQRLGAYNQLGDADNAPVSLLSYGSRVLPAAPQSEPANEPQNGEGPWWWAATPATTTTIFAPPGDGSTCGISGNLDCNMFNRMFTWDYSTHWGKGVLLWLLVITVMTCCCGGCIWRFFEVALWIALSCCCCFVLGFCILYGIFKLLDN